MIYQRSIPQITAGRSFSASIPALPVSVGSELPLSWARQPISRPRVSRVPLWFSGQTWVTDVDVPENYSFDRLYSEVVAELPRGFVIRGCGPHVAKFLTARGCTALCAGVEAVIDLGSTSLARPSVTEMVKRARRHGEVHEVAWSEQAAADLADFVRHARYGDRPQLRHLFRSSFQPGMRLWVFTSPDGSWQGALLIMLANETTAVTELLLRRANAPSGVTESLITTVGRQLRDEGVHSLSLNEAPFHYVDTQLGPLERLAHAASWSLRGVYNTAGLRRFKAKFDPIWRPVYVCAYPQVSFLTLTDLFIQSGCLSLVLHGAKRAVTFG